MLAIEALNYVESEMPEIQLPPFDEDRLYRIGGKFKGNTGLGSCNLRPRHSRLVSRAARTSLAALLTAIERVGRWPADLRWVVAAALGKKAGGGPPHRPGGLHISHLGEDEILRLQGRAGGTDRQTIPHRGPGKRGRKDGFRRELGGGDCPLRRA
jgi:hypothetical protein